MNVFGCIAESRQLGPSIHLHDGGGHAHACERLVYSGEFYKKSWGPLLPAMTVQRLTSAVRWTPAVTVPRDINNAPLVE